jgi:hypothetical protein
MPRRKEIVWMVTLGIGIFVALGTVSYFVVIHNLDRTFANVDLKPFGFIFKKAATDFLVVKQSPKELSQTRPNLEAYENNPGAFQSDARLFDTWVSAAQIGEDTLKKTLPGSWVRSSAHADYLLRTNRTDPWGHSFCLLRRNNTLVVVSAGPKALSSPICRDIKINAQELAGLPRSKLIETPAGNLIFVIDRERVSMSRSVSIQ